jgi:phenylpropionate dioxygenase-like ring-hydroxylating dioxygenase large terminal subunit
MTPTASQGELLAELARAARLPQKHAVTIPPAFYTSEEILRLEVEQIFKADWLCPGLAADMPKTGDYLTFEVAGQPIVSIRQADGSIRSFANVCVHRMMKLLDGRLGSCGRKISCPYHAWTYNLEGQVLGAGHMGRPPHFDRRDYRLPEVRTEVWEGWIYVTLNAGAPPVATLLADLQPLVARYRMAGYLPAGHQDHIWRTNWKLLCENFMEGYHLPVAHKATVGAWFPVEDTEFLENVHDAFTVQTFTKGENATYGRAHRDNTELTGHWRHTSVMPTVFPSHMYVLAPDHLWYLTLTPRSAAEVNVRFGIALAPEVDRALGTQRSRFVADLLAFFDRVNAEDRTVVEELQRGAASPLASQGPLSWLEREIQDFQIYLANRLSGARIDVTALRRPVKDGAE